MTNGLDNYLGIEYFGEETVNYSWVSGLQSCMTVGNIYRDVTQWRGINSSWINFGVCWFGRILKDPHDVKWEIYYRDMEVFPYTDTEQKWIAHVEI